MAGPLPTRSTYVRRRTVALAVAAALLLVLVSLVRGDASSPLGAGIDDRLTAAEQAKLPWRQAYASGTAGPLDGRGLPSPAAQREAVRRFHRLGLPIYCGGGRGPYVSLTFDDGPSEYSAEVVRLLERAGAQATFFLVGQNVGAHPDVPRRQVEAGGVANHTWTHPFLNRLSQRELVSELRRTSQTLARASGEPMDLMRPPFGARDPRVDRVTRRLGMVPILWDSDSRDSAGEGAEGIAANAIEGLRPGGIVLLHETYERTVSALPPILTAARQRRLKVVSVPQLLALDPPSEAQVRAGAGGCSERERFQAEQERSAMRLAGSPVS